MKIKKILEQLENKNNTPFPNYENTLLESLNVLKKEEQHSNFIYWVLTEIRIKKDESILLKEIIKKFKLVTPKQPPRIIEREKSSTTGRVDIYIEWDNYKLLLENKILSSENDKQCKAYLEDFEIDENKKNGCLIYLSPSGRTPTSIINDKRIIVANYYEFLTLLENVVEKLQLQKEKKFEKHQYLINDYILSIKRILGLPKKMKEKPEISNDTKLLLQNYQKLYVKEPYTTAIKESREMIDWLINCIKEEMKERDIMEFHQCIHGSYMYYKNNWEIKTLENNIFRLGFCYSIGSNSKTKLLNYYTHTIGLRLSPLDNKNFNKKFHNMICEKVKNNILTPNKINFRGENIWWPYIHKKIENFDVDDSWENWVGEKLEEFIKMTEIINIEDYIDTVKNYAKLIR